MHLNIIIIDFGVNVALTLQKLTNNNDYRNTISNG